MTDSSPKNWLAASTCITVVLAAALVVVAMEALHPLDAVWEDEEPSAAAAHVVDNAAAEAALQEREARIERAVADIRAAVAELWPKVATDAAGERADAEP